MGFKIDLMADSLGHKKLATIDSDALKDVTFFGAIRGAIEGIKALGTEEHSAKKRTYTGYVSRSVYDALNVSTVSIPANFAGLEAVDVPTRLQDQLFRIYEVEESEDYVTVHARHVWYDNLQNYTLWEPTKDTNYTAAAVCRNILTNAVSPTESNVASDCTDTKPGSEFDYARKNIVECFLDPENGVCAKFGLSLIRYNWDFYCLKAVGYDRGYVIQDKKNLLGVTRTESIENVVTRVAPIGTNKKGDLVWLNHNGKKYVDSQYINDYSHPRVEIYDTGLRVGQDDVTDANINAKLLEAAQKRFTEDKVDIPEITMTINFLSIGDTEEYSQYRGLDKVYLYDIVTIKDTTRGYEYSAQVVGVEHDILTGMLTSITLGTINNSDGVRKIASWQVPEVSGENIRLKTIMAGAFQPGAINADDIANGAVQWIHIDAASIDRLTTEQLEALQANIHQLIAGSITADDIAAGSITALELAANAVTTDKLSANAVTAAKLAANAVTADAIDTNSITAINAKLGVAEIATAAIHNADIDYAHIVRLDAQGATVENLIARDAVTDRYFIDKLAVRNAQMVQATVGELVIKASNNKYYRLDVAANGSVSPTEVTPSASEIASGVTSDGHGSIIETDLTVADLSASNMKAVNALIDKLTASRIDVDELWARQAFINKLMVQDISSNTYIQSTIGNWTSGSTITQSINSLDSRISSLGYGTVYMQPEEPSHSELVAGDIWVQTQPSGSWQEVYGDYSSWEYIYDNISTWQTLGGVSIMWIWDGRKWQEQLNALDSDTFSTEIAQNRQSISLLANRTTEAEGDIQNLSASLSVANDAIAAEVQRATNAENGKLAKTSQYQTADSIVSAAVAQARSDASGSYIAKTTQYQDAASIVLTAENYSDGKASTAESNAKSYADGKASSAESNAKSYADGKASSAESNAKTYADGKASTAESNAKSYANNNFYALKSGIQILAAGVEISGGKYIKILSGSTAKMLLDENGIDMQTAGRFYLHAKDATNSAIIIGTNKQTAQFSVGQSGDVTCKSLTTDSITVNGGGLPKFVISDGEPSGTGLVWIKPSSSTSKTWAITPNPRILSKTPSSLGNNTYYEDYSIPYAAEDYMAGTLKYGVTVKLWFYGLSTVEQHTLKARLKNGNSWIDLGSITQNVWQYNTLTLDVMLSSAAANVMSVSGGTFTLRIESTAGQAKAQLPNENIVLKAQASGGAGVATCAVFYKQ